MAEEATGAGVTGADFVFYISALETDRCHRGMTVAYAAHCQQEAALDRSVGEPSTGQSGVSWSACLHDLPLKAAGRTYHPSSLGPLTRAVPNWRYA